MNISNIFIIFVFIVGCSGAKDSGSGSSSSSSSGASKTADQVAMETSPLYMTIEGFWEGSTSSSFSNNCIIPNDGVTTTKSCTISIPELTLHFSDIKFTVGTSSSTFCDQIDFQPYFYRRSVSATYSLTGSSTSTIDCSKPFELSTDPVTCYGGAAAYILGNSGLTFPKFTSIYFLPLISSTHSFDLPSVQKRSDGSKWTLSTNIDVANNLVNRTSSSAVVDYIGAGNYYDYKVTCKDKYAATQFELTLIIEDLDTAATPNSSAKDEYYDWGG